MEKIYIEESQKKNSKKNIFNTSLILSFILAFVSIVSIISCGLGQISFAIPDEQVSAFPDNITFGNVTDESYKVVGMNPADPDKPIQANLIKASVNGEQKYVYCIESDINIESSKVYNKDSEITDKGLLFLTSYLLNENYKIVDETGEEVPEKVKGWIIQMAIWIYQDKFQAENSKNLLNDNDINAIRRETSLRTLNEASAFYQKTQPIFDVCKLSNGDLKNVTINQLIDKAFEVHNNVIKWDLFSIKASIASDDVTLTDDNKYYRSNLVTIVPSENGFLGYQIDLSKAPEGTYLVGEDGNKIEELDNIVEGKKFAVMVPKDKVTEENKNVTIQFTGAFTGYMAYKYVSPGVQSVIYIGELTKHVSNGLEINFLNLREEVETPDTFITTAQSVYFIGLVILLAGVGIIYANVRPSKTN